jgi:hypothetical protein
VKDWKAIAKVHGLDLPAPVLDRITAPLDALEAAFRPLAKGLTHDAEPATIFRADADGSPSGDRP